MANQNNNRKKPERQSWRPHWALRTLHGIWMVVFGAAKIALGAAATVLIICGICLLVFGASVGDYLQDDILPQVNTDNDDYDLSLNSFVYYVNRDGEIEKLQNLYAQDNREWAEYKDIPEYLIHATVAIEDKRFFEHQGVDWITTMKACVFMFFGNGDRGGSTITQQLVKNVTENRSVTVQRKVQEIFTALEYERRYDKKEILEWYLNEIYMGNRSNGVKVAAATYFGKELEMLTLAECASLISITNNPSLYNPYRETLDAGGMNGAERNRIRQMDTLDEMLAQGWITQEEYDEAVAQELVFKRGIDDGDRLVKCTNVECGYRGIASSLITDEETGAEFCPVCKKQISVTSDASQEVYSYFVDTVLEDVARDLATRDGLDWNESVKNYYKMLISRSGFHIYTTMDMDVQEALDAVYTDLEKIPKVRNGQQLQSAMVIIDNRTGDIVALAGGVGTKDIHDGLNRASDSKLQTGSSTKPLTVYAPAFESGAASPLTVISDLPQKYNDNVGWPKNDNRKYSYARTIRSGIVSSVNAVAANTLEIIGTGYAYNFAKNDFGLTSMIDSYTASNGLVMSDEDYAPLALGAQTKGLTVREMASAYATFPNNGTYREGRTYTKVYDNDGNLILDNTQDSREILSKKTIDYMNYCLGQAVSGGTGGNAKISGQKVYGKTGTTASNKDRWFCGYTGYYTAAVWCGFDTPEVIKLVESWANPAAVLFSRVLTPVHNGLAKVSLEDFSNMRTAKVCLDSGLLATAACELDVRITDSFGRTDSALAYREDIPTKHCTKHVQVEFCKEGGAVCNEYCRLFAQEPESSVILEQKALVKMTQEEIDELVKAKTNGLLPEYLQDNYVYLVTKDGKDGVFKGFEGTANPGVDAPYVICTLHTKEAWEAYQESLVPEETTEVTEPVTDANKGTE